MGSVLSRTRLPIIGTERELQMEKFAETLEKSAPQSSLSSNRDSDCCFDHPSLVSKRIRTSDLKRHCDCRLNEEHLSCRKKIYDSQCSDEESKFHDPSSYEYPFENLVMAGGGNKGQAYCGAINCLEVYGILKNIKRFGGASAGALTVALLALDYTSDDLKRFWADGLKEKFNDHSCGWLSLINVMFYYGWNPGARIYEWFGERIKEKTGNPDFTFFDLYKRNGRELCIVVTNLNLMKAEYCHPKTTPDMPIRAALRMTMALPGVFYPVPYQNHGNIDTYVDGGVVCNYPINCFDGWYLSMKPEDVFLKKIEKLKDLSTMTSYNERFKKTEFDSNKTIGLLVFENSERELMRYHLEKRFGCLLPDIPDTETPLYKMKAALQQASCQTNKEHSQVAKAADAFLKVLSRHNKPDVEVITLNELQAAMDDNSFTDKHREILFGRDCDATAAFDNIDKDGNEKISFQELIQFMELRGIRMQIRFQGYSRQEIKNVKSFGVALYDTLLTNLKYVSVTKDDVNRTVGINTGHVGTLDYNLEQADRDFIIQRGYEATLGFLQYFAKDNEDVLRPKKENVITHQPSTSYPEGAVELRKRFADMPNRHEMKDASWFSASSQLDAFVSGKRNPQTSDQTHA